MDDGIKKAIEKEREIWRPLKFCIIPEGLSKDELEKIEKQYKDNDYCNATNNCEMILIYYNDYKKYLME